MKQAIVKHENQKGTNSMNAKTVSANPSRGISGSTLKIIAMGCMLIDHFGAAILEQILYARGLSTLTTQEQFDTFIAANNTLYLADITCRVIGRIAFPIFCFLLIQGFCYTHSRLKYCGNLLLFALISEIPFDLAFNRKLLEFTYQNIFFTLGIALAALCLLELIAQKHYPQPVQLLLTLLTTVSACALATLLKTDYGAFGVLTIIIMYMFRTQKFLCAALGCTTLTVMSLSEISAFLSLIPIRLYNGKRGLKLKYLFYAFYPVHLLILAGIATLLL